MLNDREQIMMEDRNWTFDDEEPAIKFDRSGNEIGREDDEVWAHDLAEVRSLL